MLVIWDSSTTPPDSYDNVYSWTGYAESGPVRSILRYVESNGNRLREKYTSWVYELGRSEFDGKSIVEHLELEEGFSYWWMTLLVEQNLWKSPQISDAIRCLALEEILLAEMPGKVLLCSDNQDLNLVIAQLCRGLDIGYEWRPVKQITNSESLLMRLYRSLPEMVQGFVFLARHLITRKLFKKTGHSSWSAENDALFVCGFFFHVDRNHAKQQRFKSNYWTGLHTLIEERELPVNWLQLYYPHNAIPSAQTAVDMAEGFNAHPKTNGHHHFLDAYLSWAVVKKVLLLWARLARKSYKLKIDEGYFRPANSKVSFWPLLKRDLHGSLYGAAAIDNLLWFVLFDEAMRDMPHQSKGLYLCENQAWERALIRAWRKHGHGKLIAVAHATIRFWDLRYFPDPRVMQTKGLTSLPCADAIALNGKSALDSFREFKIPEELIVKSEALRYGYLQSLQNGRPLSGSDKEGIDVLVLGDFIPKSMGPLLKVLEEALPSLPDNIRITIKPHPNNIINVDDYPALNAQLETRPLGDIIQNYDVAYAGNMTSAAIDAYVAGLAVIVQLDDEGLNVSPLRGQAGVAFVSTPAELVEAFVVISSNEQALIETSGDFFYLDPELPLLKRALLGE